MLNKAVAFSPLARPEGLGSSVTLLAWAEGLLPRMEPFVGELVGRGLADAGVDVRVGVTVTGVHRPQETGPVTLTLEDGGELEADEVLFATGRQPLTDDIGLETLGLEPGSWLEIDETGLVRAVEDSWRLPARCHIRRPSRGGADPFGDRCRGRAGIPDDLPVAGR